MSRYIKDLTLRVGVAFAFTFISTYSLTDQSNPRNALIAGAAASLEVIRGLLGKFVGDPESAGFHA